MKQSYTIGESRAISHSDDTEQRTSKWLKSSKEHRLAQRRQRRERSDHKHVQRQRQNTTITL